ncbi:TetR/AcrR family transcriptional regulator [Nocardia otitidiscaviarum]|uniref:TetR/AcrR family transcriptional regulator n=1 Tax=Nocardia otitidiscaviarum TaxID=1823 RepID=UPI00163DAD4B|nr:TetR/AcrR family transcriptional regulator [Nocardia otitidiscaviarum]MCP9620800.1 TetR/AcrR family transcriptional regulator [Nocardia otitidiscaviarum]
MIITTATEVFAESGYQRATMGQIAARLGVTEPVLFQNFGSKTGLYAATVAHATGRMVAMLSDLAARADSVGALLRQLLSPDHIDELHAPGSLGVIFADAMTLAAEPAIEAAVRQHLGDLATALSEIVARGQNDGELHTGLDPEAVAWMLLSFLSAHRFRTAVMPDRRRLEERIAAMTLNMILPSGETPTPRRDDHRDR